MVKQKKEYKRICCICNKDFTTVYQRQHVCSFICHQEKSRETARRFMRVKRNKYSKNTPCKPCTICGWNITTDLHHEGKRLFQLCPNHHALITRGIRTLEQLIKERDERQLKNMQEILKNKPVNKAVQNIVLS